MVHMYDMKLGFVTEFSYVSPLFVMNWVPTRPQRRNVADKYGRSAGLRPSFTLSSSPSSRSPSC